MHYVIFSMPIILSMNIQVKELDVKVRSREAEFERYREEVTLRPESKLQAELSVAQLEKV